MLNLEKHLEEKFRG